MAILLPNGKQSFTGSGGLPLVGGKVYTYAAGTNTPQATWADAAQTAPNTNPIILDARGEASVFWNGTYKVVLCDALGAVIWTQDNIGGATSTSIATVASLAASSPSSSSAILTQPGRFGIFTYNPAGQVAAVAADPAQAQFVPPASDPTGASGAWVRQGVGNLDAGWYGALNGGLATTAITLALNAARDNPQSMALPSLPGQCLAVELEPGIYQAGAIIHDVYTAANASGTSTLILRAKQPGTVFIVIPDGQYFLSVTNRATSIDCYGITFVGGAGALRNQYTGVNVDNPFFFERCLFYNYTVCAISNNAVDAPYLRVRDCRFTGTDTSKGIAWSGLSDLGEVHSCVFDRNKYHIKIGNGLSSTFSIKHNDFIKNAQAGFKAADIWIVGRPDLSGISAGQASLFDNNKFGNENLALYETRVLLANEDPASGTDWGSRGHSTAHNQPGYVTGLTFSNNFVGQKSALAGAALPDGNDAPFLTSYYSPTNVRNLRWLNNGGEGGRYQWLAYFYADPDPVNAYVGQSWHVQLDPTVTFQYGVVNADIGIIDDPFGVMQGDPRVRRSFPIATDPPIVAYDGRFAPTGAGLGATIAPGPTDAYGGTSTVLVTLPNANSVIYGTFANIGYAGLRHWIEGLFSPVADPTRRMREVIFNVYNQATGQKAWQTVVQIGSTVTVGPVSFVRPVSSNGDESQWRWQVLPSIDPAGGAFTQFLFGRPFVSVGDGPVNSRSLYTVGDAWNQPGLTMGAYQLWFDANHRLRRKGGSRATSDLDGDGIPITAAAQPNSNATTVAGLQADLNTLLTNLRASGAIGS